MLERGVSPRVMKARVRGTRGSTVVTGPQIRARLGLRDTWFYVRRVRTSQGGGAEARTLRGVAPLVDAARHRGRRKPALRHAPAPHRGDGWKDDGEFPLEDGALQHPRRHARDLPRDGGVGTRAELLVQPPATG